MKQFMTTKLDRVLAVVLLIAALLVGQMAMAVDSNTSANSDEQLSRFFDGDDW